MAVNHTVIREEKSDGTVELTASSPDEQAFVAGAFVAGVQFLGMDYETSVVKLNVLGRERERRVRGRGSDGSACVARDSLRVVTQTYVDDCGVA